MFSLNQKFKEKPGKQLTDCVLSVTITCVIAIMLLLWDKGEYHGKESDRYGNNDT